MVVGEYKGDDRVKRVAVHECEDTRIGVDLACVRNGGKNNYSYVNVCARTGEGVRIVVCGVSK